MREADFLPIVDAYHAILAGDDELSRAVIEAGSNLKVIGKWGVGVDAIDFEAAADGGVAFSRTSGVSATNWPTMRWGTFFSWPVSNMRWIVRSEQVTGTNRVVVPWLGLRWAL